VDVRVVQPSQLLAEAAEVLAGFRNEVVVIGATALEVALADGAVGAITPTRDVDVVVPTERAAVVVAELERSGWHRSELDYERAFTWVRDDLKIELVRTFHPFAKPPASALPVNAVFGMAAAPAHQIAVAFADAPDELRLRCANAACLVALKQAAFGRIRKPDNIAVERDYHDVHLLLASVPEVVIAELAAAEYEVRTRALDAITQLAASGVASTSAARQIVRLGGAPSQAFAEADVLRAATIVKRRLETGTQP
jgi:hypothetical protein